MSGLTTLLRRRNGLAYLSAAVCAALAGGSYFVVIAWHLFQTKGSALSIGGLFVAMALPGLLLSPVVGVLLDRWNPRRVCITADLVRGGMLLLLALGIAAGSVDSVAIYAASFVLALCDNFFQPAVAVLVRDMVSEDELLSANIAGSMASQTGTLAGAGAAGVGLAAFGIVPVMVTAALLLLASSALLSLIRSSHRREAASPVSARKPHILAEFVQGLRAAPQRELILTLAVQLALAYVTVFACNTLLPAFVARDLGANANAFGLIDAGWGVGALAGGLILARVAGRTPMRTLGAVGLLLLAAGLAALSAAQAPLQAALAYTLLGCLAVMLRIHGDTTLLKTVAPGSFGKIKSGIVMIISWASLAVYVAAGALGDALSTRWAYFAVACMVGGCGLFMLSRMRRSARTSLLALPAVGEKV